MFKKWKKKLSLFWRGWGCSIVIALLIATSFKSAIADWNHVPTGSMKPTILEGDRIFVNKLAYDLKIPYTTVHLACWNDPKRGDIVVFFSPADGKRLVKRVVGVPGDTVSMHNNRLFINGKTAAYEALDKKTIDQIAPHEQLNHLFFSENIVGNTHPVMITPMRPSLCSFSPVVVPQKHYFMMGDNRDNSSDSRFFGFVDRKQIVGRATAVVISLKRHAYYLPRWDRFFYKLL
jgi:signal peptidase I